ncbi:MAG: RNA polymerase sigma factor [Syntrophothermus sp.]
MRSCPATFDESHPLHALYVEHCKELRHYTYGVCRDWSLAEEAVQEAFLRAFSRYNQLRDCAKSYKWLCRISVNIAKRMLQKRRREMPVEVADSCAATRCSPEALCMRRESLEDVLSAIERLPQNLREVFVSHYVHGRRVDEIASHYGIHRGTVKSRLSRARTQLRDQLLGFQEYA